MGVGGKGKGGLYFYCISLCLINAREVFGGDSLSTKLM